ncbi:MAG TPA: cell division protein FtsA [Nitrospiria bacterium]|nr:cell division protein FtsA [Nitrospiria bacterium]
MKHIEEIIVGLDIGTTKICAIVAVRREDGPVEVVGLGTHPSRGLRKGVVVNIESTVESVKQAIEEAELMAGVEIHTVYTGIAGGHIKGFNSRGVIAVRDAEVTRHDVQRVIDAAKAVAIPMDREILHVIPQEFILDGQEGIKDPLGMSGVRLEADVHIITAAATTMQNIVKCVNRAGLDVAGVILQPLASSEAVLRPEEKEQGVAMIDIGGGTTDLAIFLENSLWHTAVLGIGGNHLTNDIAVGLRTPAIEAERIKLRHGCAMTSLVRADEMVEVPSVGGRQPRVLPRQLLTEIIEPRVEEIFSLAAQEIRRTGHEEQIVSGAVLTGGAALTEGIIEVAERVLGMPVRRGAPVNVGGLTEIVTTPIYSTGVGLILYVLEQQQEGELQHSGHGGLLSKTSSRVRGWIKEWF